METRRTLLVDAFTDEPLAGNVAGVVPDATGLNDDRMGQIAAELGASETAFVFDAGDGADERLRYFTPSTEVDLCGHATIASYAALYAEGAIEAGDRTLRTNVGDLSIEIEKDGTVWMRQNPPTVDVVGIESDEAESDGIELDGIETVGGETDTAADDSGAEAVEPLDTVRLGHALGIDPAALRDIGADLPIAVASTGLPWLAVPVNFLQRLGEAEPDAAAIEAISAEYDVAGVYAFTFDTLDAESTLHGRAFAPAVGIAEDPATGTASGAVGAYLRAVDAFDGDLPSELRFEQGHFLDRPGKVRVRVEGGAVRVGGTAVVSTESEMQLPDEDDAIGDDGIIEA